MKRIQKKCEQIEKYIHRKMPNLSNKTSVTIFQKKKKWEKKLFSSEIYILMTMESDDNNAKNVAINFDWNTKIIENITTITNKLMKMKN